MAIDEHDEQTEDMGEELSLRDQIEDSWDEAESDDTAEPMEHDAVASNDGRVRDEKGRFAKSEEQPIGHDEPPAVQPEGQADQPEGEEAPEPAQELRAPQSWKPGAREHWAELPDSVKDEVYRREHGMQQYLSQTAEERKLAQAFHNVYAPYEAMIRGENSNPIQAVESLLQTAYQLRVSPPAQKAQLVAGLINQFGVPIDMLDAALTSGVTGQRMPQQPQQAPMQDPRVDQIMQALQANQKQQSEQREQAAYQEIAQFGQQHEFLDDVRDHMADLMEVAGNRGVVLSLEDAYNQACMLNPEIRSVIEQRQRAQAAGEASNRTARSRRAASSVGGAPTKAPRKGPGEMSIREAALQAFEEHAGG